LSAFVLLVELVKCPVTVPQHFIFGDLLDPQ